MKLELHANCDSTRAYIPDAISVQWDAPNGTISGFFTCDGHVECDRDGGLHCVGKYDDIPAYSMINFITGDEIILRDIFPEDDFPVMPLNLPMFIGMAKKIIVYAEPVIDDDDECDVIFEMGKGMLEYNESEHYFVFDVELKEFHCSGDNIAEIHSELEQLN